MTNILSTKTFFNALCMLLLLCATSCSTSKQILYFQNINDTEMKPQNTAYEAVIKKDDRLAIVVSGPDKTVTAPYNLTMGEMTGAVSTSGNPENSTLTYLVDPMGNIDFPNLGTIHVEGMTRNQLVTYLKGEIGKDVKDPIVYVAFKNYKITILGEVKAPGTYTMDGEKVTLLQALGRAGDLNLTAKRDGILLIREEDGVERHYNIDLKDAELLNSPQYYLQQNDVIYVPASNIRVANATSASGILGITFSSISTAISVITMAITLSKVNK